MKTVIIGSGMAGVGLAEELKKMAPEEDITIVTEDIYGYYHRPLLSHSFAKPENAQRMLAKSYDEIRKQNIHVESGARVVGVDRANKELKIQSYKCSCDGEHQNADSDCCTIKYDRLVFATGSDAFVPPVLRPLRSKMMIVNTYSDWKLLQQIRSRLREKFQLPRWLVIGGGLIGCELASDLREAGDQVKIVHMADRLLERVLTPEKSMDLLNHLQSRMINVVLNNTVINIEYDQDHSGETAKYNVTLQDGSKIMGYDGVILSVGFAPRTQLASDMGLKTNRGIITNAKFQTEDESIFALGDVAEVDGKLYPFVAPIRSQFLFLAKSLAGKTAADEVWQVPEFKPAAKIHGWR